MIKYCAFFIFLFASLAAAEPPGTFSNAKRLAKELHADHRTTFYCGCKYDKHGKVDLHSCGYQIQKNKRRAERLEWEHIMPVSVWGVHFSCWNEPLCCNRQHCYKGRACCREINPEFAKMEADLHNIVPEIGELNAVRSNYRFGMLPHVATGQFGACEFKVDKETRRVEPRAMVRGMVARAYLYMANTYSIHLSPAQHQLFAAWNKEYPPDAWEVLWDNRIAMLQGNHNLYITHYLEKR